MHGLEGIFDTKVSSRGSAEGVTLSTENYNQYNSDVIYNDIQNDFLNSDGSMHYGIRFDWSVADADVTSYTAPVAQSTPKTGDTNLFTAFAMLVSGMISGAAAFITKKKNA